DRVGECVEGFGGEGVAPRTGVAPGAIRDLARDFAAAERAVWYGRVGVCTQEFGALCQWLIYALNIVTGNLDRPGGAMFPRPAVDPLGLSAARYKGFRRWRSRVRGLPEFYGELPTAVMAEEMVTPGPRQGPAPPTLAGHPA